MGWAVGYDSHWQRDIGYGVPAYCDHPGCTTEIDRGLSYVCGGEPYGGDEGCGLYFCGRHLFMAEDGRAQVCERCEGHIASFDAKPDHSRWIQHKLTDESWAEWRAEHPSEVARLVNAGATDLEQGAPESAPKSEGTPSFRGREATESQREQMKTWQRLKR